MKRIASGAAVLAITLAVNSPVQAGPASSALGKCLVQSSTGKDRIVFMQWFFAALSVNPNVATFAVTTKDQRDAATRNAAEVFDRLIFTDCHAEAEAAEREDGDTALSTGFEAFGRIAVTELMSDPKVGKEMSTLGDYVDKAKWATLANIGKK